jgi:hypothetical protein
MAIMDVVDDAPPHVVLRYVRYDYGCGGGGEREMRGMTDRRQMGMLDVFDQRHARRPPH